MLQKDLYGLVLEYCNVGPVQDLLRKYKADVPKEKKSDVRVSGKNQAEIVDVNLRRAVASGIILPAEVFALLQDAEENGSQHIFYFRPKNVNVAEDLRNAEKTATSLWGQHWRSQMGFPKLELIPDNYTWSDFRDGLPGKPNDWLAKLYGHETHFKFTEQEKVDDRHFIRHYVKDELRTVCVVRWNNPDILELRIPRSDSNKDRDRRLALLWQFLTPAINQADLVRWNLAPCRKEMLRRAEDEEEKKIYEIGDQNFIDSESCRTSINMHTPDDMPHAAACTKKAIQAHINSDDSECDRLVVFWKENDLNGLKKPLRVQVGGVGHTHEVIVSSQTGAKAVDYVTNQLRRLSD